MREPLIVLKEPWCQGSTGVSEQEGTQTIDLQNPGNGRERVV
jgi:hypothetical protein